MSKVFTALGLMTGTSMDGIDASIIKTDGEKVMSFGESLMYSYDSRERYRILVNSAFTSGEAMAAADIHVTRLHAEAVERLLDKAKLKPSDIDVIGFHGQTILHRPEKGISIQLGNGSLLTTLTGIDVVYNFRQHDIAAGGQGAPLVPVFHSALWKANENANYPVAFLNLGGVANITYIPSSQSLQMIAFDSGPGNALLDDWVNFKTGQDFDHEGHYSSKGKVNKELLEAALADKFFAKAPPKSLDRGHFTLQPFHDLSVEDGAATLAAFTAESVIRSANFFPEKPKAWLVCGGGRKNPTIMKMLSEKLEGVTDIKSAGFDGDMLEAQAFAFLAVRSLLRLPLSFPRTTGVKTPTTGGVLAKH